jgi:hypothetical protein
MAILSAQYDPNIGPLIDLILTPPAILRQIAQPQPLPASNQPSATAQQQPQIFGCKALIDTGASITSITAQLAAQAGLPLIGKRQLGTAGGTVNANVYVADVAIPFSAMPPGTPGSQVQLQNLQMFMLESTLLLEFNCASPHFNMLLGRDIICRGIFSLGFDNRYTLSL